MKVLAKATAILVPMAVPCIHRPEWGDISETFVRGLFVCFFFSIKLMKYLVVVGFWILVRL